MAILLATWFAWSVAAYGTKSTFASNTTLTPGDHYQGGTLVKIGGNLVDSVVPTVLRDPSLLGRYPRSVRAGDRAR